MTTQADRGRFVWHELLTRDPAAAQTFYKHVVGWGTSMFEGAPMEYTMWMAGETPVGGVMEIPPEAARMGMPPQWLAYIEVPDVDETVAQAEKLGASVQAPAQTIENVGRFAVLGDPQGAVFGIITNAQPLPEESDAQLHHFSWHELITPSWKEGEKFYHALFGWVKQSEMDMGAMGTYYMFGRDRFTYGGMYDKPENMPAPPSWLHYVMVDSADAATERATGAGAKVLTGPMDVPGGGRITILMDPQGAAFAVHSKGAG